MSKVSRDVNNLKLVNALFAWIEKNISFDTHAIRGKAVLLYGHIKEEAGAEVCNNIMK